MGGPGKVMSVAAGLCMTIGLLVAQFVLPFAFDFLSTLAIFGVGIWTGLQVARSA